MKKIKSIFGKLLVFLKLKKIKETKLDQYIPSKQPFIVIINNTTDEVIENVPLFFGNAQNQQSFNLEGNFVENGLMISSGVPNVTYNHMCKNLITEKADIGLTYMQSENNKQILEKFTIKKQDTIGNLSEKVITPTVDPYQQQTNIVAVKERYSLDGNTAIIISKVQAKTSLKIYFYPEINFDLHYKL